MVIRTRWKSLVDGLLSASSVKVRIVHVSDELIEACIELREALTTGTFIKRQISECCFPLIDQSFQHAAEILVDLRAGLVPRCL